MTSYKKYTLRVEIPETINLALKDVAEVERNGEPTFLEREKLARLKRVLQTAKNICKELGS